MINNKLLTSCLPLILKQNMSSKPTTTLIIEKLHKITTIGINRPEKRNCVDSHTALELKNAIADFEADEEALAGVLYGIGGNFCSGYDLNELANSHSTMVLDNLGHVGPTLRPLKKPLVAAVSGYAVAGGLELALMCDLRVVEDTAVLGVYCRRFGVPLVDGGTVRLQAMVGLSRALDLILTGRSLNAKEAFEWGIANRLVACGTGLGQAINLASSLVKFPQKCLHADRESTYNAAFNSAYQELLDFEQRNANSVLYAESVEGAKKFMAGVGRHGKSYHLTEKEISEWEKEFDSSQTVNNNTKSKL